MIRKRKCGCEFILERVNGLSTVSAGKIIKKCFKHRNMSESEIIREPFKIFNKLIKEKDDEKK